jgi:hypothetical protein
MPNITDPSAVLFCNNSVRSSADRIVQCYWYWKTVKEIYLANPNLATLIPNDATALVVDGSATDGRTPIYGADVQLLLTNVNALITTLEANSGALLNAFSKIAVNQHP